MSPGEVPFELKVEIAQLSDPGRDPNKQINEDSCGHQVTAHGYLVVLCDGMGGHYGGQEASRRAIATVFELVGQAATGPNPRDILRHAIEVAGRRVYELGGPPENKVRPGSTIVAMLLHDGGADVAHVGDSRAYIIRSGQIYPLTRDHSMVQAMIDAGYITEQQAIGHPDANKITRALGMKVDVEVEVRPDPMELFAGDLLLTASDGLTDLALGHEILEVARQSLSQGGLQYSCEQLVRMANDRGGHDNITVQLVRIETSSPGRTRTGATQAGSLEGSYPDRGTEPIHLPYAAASNLAAAGGIPMAMQSTAFSAPAGSNFVGHQAPAHPMHQPHPQGPAGGGFQPHNGGFPAPQAPVGRPGYAHALSPGPGPVDHGAGPVSVGAHSRGFHVPAGPTAVGPTHVGPTHLQSSPPHHDAGPASQATAHDGTSRHSYAAFAPGAAGPVARTFPPQTNNTAIDSGRRPGGNVLFLALAISFVVAIVMVAFAWVLFFR